MSGSCNCNGLTATALTLNPTGHCRCLRRVRPHCRRVRALTVAACALALANSALALATSALTLATSTLVLAPPPTSSPWSD